MSTHRPDEAQSRREDPLIGAVLAEKYRVQELIAAGGMGHVYRGQQIALDRPIAVKLVAPFIDPADERRQTAEFRARFLLEASTLAKLQHRNIVTIFDYGATLVGGERRFFMVMEYLQGETLLETLKKRAPLTENETLDLAIDMARGLREAHRQGVVHRDLKPSNVMLVKVDGEDTCKLLDFGLVKVMSQEGPGITQTGVFLGSPTYIAPEQVEQGHVDARTDIYSLGVIMFECLTGRPPFVGSTMDLLSAHANDPAPRMKSVNPDTQVATQVEEFVLSCLAKDPDDRPEGADDFLDRLRSSSLRYHPSSSKRLRPVKSTKPPLKVTISEPPSGPISSPEAGSPDSSFPGQGPSSGNPSSSNQQVFRRKMISTPPRFSPTPPAEARSVAPPRRARSKSSTARLVALGVAGFVITLGLGFLAINLLDPPAESTPAAAIEASIRSEPSGAEVWQGARKLGRTPLKMRLTGAAVGKAGKPFQLRKAGYQPYGFTIKPGQPRVKIQAKLVKLPK